MNIINKTKNAIGFLYLRLGIKTIKDIVFDIPITKIRVIPVLSGMKLYGTELDMQYYTTDWDNWSEILDRVYSILGDNKWTEDKADCDNRAEFVSALISIVYNLNTCGRVFCEVSNPDNGTLKYLHWCNLIIDKDSSIYLFDADNGGLKQKIYSTNIIMGGNKYNLKSFRIG